MRKLPDRLDSPWLPLLLAAILAFLFIFGMLRRAEYDASWFVTAGDSFCDPARVPHNLSVQKNSEGYDGQFYYRLALNPFTSKRTDDGIIFDIPSVRQQRILYPLLAWALSFGNARLLLFAMLFINFAALCWLGWLGGVYAQLMKRHAFWGILLALYPGSLLTLTRDLVELLLISLVVSSFLLLRCGKHVTATLLLVFAVLTKETALLVPVAALMVYSFDYLRKQEARIKWHYFAFPLATYFIWQLILFYNWGAVPVLSNKMSLTIPFTGFIGLLRATSAYQTEFQRKTFPELIFLIGFVMSVCYCLRSTKASLPEILSWLLYVVLALFLSRTIWIEDWAFLRAVTELCVLGTMILIGSKSKITIPIFGCSLLLWFSLFVRLLQGG